MPSIFLLLLIETEVKDLLTEYRWCDVVFTAKPKTKIPIRYTFARL